MAAPGDASTIDRITVAAVIPAYFEAKHIADVLLFQISGDDRRHGGSIDRHALRMLRHFQRTTGWKSAA